MQTQAKICKVGERMGGATRIEGSVTMFWATKAQAIAAAKSIGWPVNSVCAVFTRFQAGWSLHWGINKPGHISRDEWATLDKRDSSEVL
jgi:hypothetical protein